jgi:hypothetical protein
MNFVQKLYDVFTKSVDDKSDAGKIDQTDLAKVGKNAILVGVAAAVSAVLASVGPEMLGTYQPLIILGLTGLLDVLNRLIKSNK